MSDENEAAQIDAEPPTPPPEGDSASADASEVTLDSEHADSAKPRSRDAKTRLELRETKARLERMQRAEAERIARDHLADPTDMWVAGVSVNDLLDERGDLDTEKITATVEQLIEAHPHWRPHNPRRRRSAADCNPAPAPPRSTRRRHGPTLYAGGTRIRSTRCGTKRTGPPRRRSRPGGHREHRQDRPRDPH